jgi:hypothetical protein
MEHVLRIPTCSSTSKIHTKSNSLSAMEAARGGLPELTPSAEAVAIDRAGMTDIAPNHIEVPSPRHCFGD